MSNPFEIVKSEELQPTHTDLAGHLFIAQNHVFLMFVEQYN